MKHKVLMTLTVFTVILTGLQTRISAQGMVHALWQYQTTEEITYLRIVDDSLLLSGTKLGLECLNASKGYVLWQTTAEDSVMGFNVGHIKDTPYLLELRSQFRTYRASRFRGGAMTLVKRNKLSVMNVNTGAVLWDS